MAEKLDISKTITTSDDKPTAYMEDVISQLVDAVGGEQAESVPDQIAINAIQGFINLAQIKALRM